MPNPNPNPNPRALIEGRPALVVIDIQASTFIDDSDERSIPNMPNYRQRMEAAIPLVAACHDADVPVVFIQEIHRPDHVDFGRELDGEEDVHCLAGDPRTEVALEEMGGKQTDYIVPKRRYSAFFGTDLEILLKGLKVDTLILVGVVLLTGAIWFLRRLRLTQGNQSSRAPCGFPAQD